MLPNAERYLAFTKHLSWVGKTDSGTRCDVSLRTPSLILCTDCTWGGLRVHSSGICPTFLLMSVTQHSLYAQTFNGQATGTEAETIAWGTETLFLKDETELDTISGHLLNYKDHVALIMREISCFPSPKRPRDHQSCITLRSVGGLRS